MFLWLLGPPAASSCLSNQGHTPITYPAQSPPYATILIFIIPHCSTLFQSLQVVGPSLEHRDTNSVPWAPPTHCPVCSTPLASTSDRHLECPNQSCAARVGKRLAHFAERCLKYSGLGKGSVPKLLEAGLISDVPSLWELDKVRLLMHVCAIVHTDQ